MSLDQIKLGKLSVSRLIIGGNPFSGISHQGGERNRQMLGWYTTSRIKQALASAEQEGVNTFLGRADKHVIRLLLEYRDEGGKIQWIAQSAPEFASVERCINSAVAGGADAMFIHGGQTDLMFAQGQMELLQPLITRIRDAGLPAGIAGHNPQVHQWANDHLDLDFYMCSYYNPVRRDKQAEQVAGIVEMYDEEDRQAMTALIATLNRPVIHYKVLAAGRNDPDEAFAVVAKHLRQQDAVCVGIYTQDNPHMVRENVERLQRCLHRQRT